MPPRETWYDENAGRLVRPYAVTRGRTRAGSHDLQLITLILAVDPVLPGQLARLDPEHRQILTLCSRPTSVAEISAALRLPLSVVKILIGDLVEQELVHTRSAVTPDPSILRAVIDGIRQL
jgi:hypothetical protein